MTPPTKLWTFPPRLSVADGSFQSKIIDYEHDYNLDHSQILTDLDTQFLNVDAAIDAAIKQLDRRLACTLTRVLAKDNNQRNSSMVLTEEIAAASQATDRQLSSISRLEELVEEVERIGHEYSATARQALITVNWARIWAMNRLFEWLGLHYLDRAQQEWSYNRDRLSKIHQVQTAVNQTIHSLA